MILKNKLPLQLFIILEKLNINIWTNNISAFNNYYILVKNNSFITLSYIFKNEVFLNDSSLIESSYVDYNLNSLKITNNFYFSGFSNFDFYFFNLKIKINVLIYNKNFANFFFSIDKIFINSSWLERESSEMYGLKFINKNDSRNLLLDYSKKENVMLKNYPVEGFNDLFFSFFENQITINQNYFIEL